MDNMLKDFGYAGRALRKHPVFAAVAVLTIALGIGACSAIFSVVNAVLLRPLPYSDAQRLVIVWGELRARAVNDWPWSPRDFRDLRLQSKTLADVAAVTPAGRQTVPGANGGEAQQVRVAGATPNLFRVLGARIITGRDFTEEDGVAQPTPPAAGPPAPRLPRIVMLSYGFWQRRYGGDTSIVGKNIDLGGGRAQVAGVLGYRSPTHLSLSSGAPQSAFHPHRAGRHPASL